MNWMDYREKLGISYNNKELFSIIRNKVINLINYSVNMPSYSYDEMYRFCMRVGLSYGDLSGDGTLDSLAEIFESKCENTKELVLYYVAFVQTCDLVNDGKLELIEMLQSILKESRCEFEIFHDDDGYFLFPKGAEMLDNKLVSDTLIWLDGYPQTKKTFSIALKQYSDSVFIRDTADNFRKSLEDFFKEFLQNSKNLETNIPLIGAFLKENGASEEIAKILVGLVNLYSTLNNKVAKHHDNIDSKFLEFLMYQTGLFIRMLMVVNQKSH